MAKSKKIISFEIPDNLREILRVKAFNENVSMSEMIRRILIEQLKNDIGEIDGNSRLKK